MTQSTRSGAQPRGLRPQHGRLASHEPASEADGAARARRVHPQPRVPQRRRARGYDTDADGNVDPGERRPRLPARPTSSASTTTRPRTRPACPRRSARACRCSTSPHDRLPRHRQPQRSALPAPVHGLRLGDRPEGLRNVLRLAASYKRPIYVTENGIDDADDSQRPELPRQPPARGAARRSPTGPRCAATSTGRSSTTSSGQRATTPASGCTRSIHGLSPVAPARARGSTRGSRRGTPSPERGNGRAKYPALSSAG